MPDHTPSTDLATGRPAGAAARASHGVSIQLVELTKQYPGQPAPAVERVSMDIAPGEMVMFLGPSGCGKTTTMKMINRLIEPTSGQILIDGQDVLKLDPNELRRSIGYVIQQIGLFPHMTIGENIELVPRLLGWSKTRTRERVAELLDLVGLDPSVYRERYPRQLSGGQQQRVGVARALAADPPVMLMDEPFGATDPITREHLQNEFLRLQKEIRKTIIFVTHDFDEAVRLGDRIAVLRDRSAIAQFDTPERILSAPADDYVASFVGSAAAIRRMGLTTVADALRLVSLDPSGPAADATVDVSASIRDAIDAMLRSGSSHVDVRDDSGSVIGSLGFDRVCELWARAGQGGSHVA
ncbi:ABC transporter ATP-binding protein [Nocardioides mesophilus]|uniref:ABC-type quaternary amine transporter n=1 Tax=Nocardioides mesophilus TaxID=433659 RepID=A0A7G9R8G3_9ACTN|nr:ABC transporter ATP-binding protein [Nocardioides mesophilus]QNN51888.1 ABC transporter ATP-binding protein [Nocardioides mesophilus]